MLIEQDDGIPTAMEVEEEEEELTNICSTPQYGFVTSVIEKVLQQEMDGEVIFKQTCHLQSFTIPLRIMEKMTTLCNKGWQIDAVNHISSSHRN